MVWLTGRLAPDFKTIADFRHDNGPAIREVCAQFVTLCRNLHILDGAAVAIDGSKFKAVNHREKNFTHDRLMRRIAAIAVAFALQSARRLHLIEIAVDVDLEESCRMIAWPASSLRLDATNAELCQIERVEEHVDHAHV